MAVAIVLTSCASPANNDSKQTQTPNETVNSPSATATPLPTPSDEIVYTPFELKCAQLITEEELYSFNPNFSFVSDTAESSSELSTFALSNKGTSCTYMNLSGGATILLTVVKVDDSSKDALVKDLSTKAEEIDENNGTLDRSFFSIQQGVGTAQVLRGNYLVSAQSSFFSSYLDAGDFLNIALSKIN